MKKLAILLVTALFLIACGSNDSTSHPTPPPSSDVDMELSKAYTLLPGDSIIKNDESARLEIQHIDGQAESTVTLLEGSATIIRK